MTPIQGSCLCGTIAFDIEPAPGVFRYCYCTLCRKNRGTRFAANLLVPPERFHWIRGEDEVRRYDLPDSRFGNCFCGQCGTPMPRLTQSGRSVVIPAGVLDEDPGIRPENAVFRRSCVPWLPNAEELEQHDAFASADSPTTLPTAQGVTHNTPQHVSLEPITFDNFEAVIDLQLTAEQRHYLPSNMFSIAESSLSPLFYPRAIHADGTVVGFCMYQFGAAGADDEDECTIWRFMIDRRHQNRGIGRRAMTLLLAEIESHDRCSLIDIYYSADNRVARDLYRSFGFREVGHRNDGDLIAELALNQS